jgi:hypothetical protein
MNRYMELIACILLLSSYSCSQKSANPSQSKKVSKIASFVENFNSRNNFITNFDLNGDGKIETVSKTNSHHSGFSITINKTYTIYHVTCLMDIDKYDDIVEFASTFNDEADVQYWTEMNYFNGDEIIYMGMFKANAGLYGASRFTITNNMIKAQERINFLYPWYVVRNLKLNSNHLLEYSSQTNYSMNAPVTLLVDLAIKSKRGNITPTIIIRKDSKATLLYTDLNRWVFIRDEFGNQGWFEVESGHTMVGTGLFTSDVFDGLCFCD